MLIFLNKNNRNKGFSFIELLVGMAIMVIATTAILSIIVSATRISAKNMVADTARQNGNYATARIIKMIQFADSYNGESPRSNNANAGSTSDTQYVANSCSGNLMKAININYDGKEKIIQCRTQGSKEFINLVNEDGSNEELISTNSNKNIIVVSNCNFVCKRVIPTASPVITFSFDLNIGGANAVAERRTAIPFRTSVKMRNE